MPEIHEVTIASSAKPCDQCAATGPWHVRHYAQANMLSITVNFSVTCLSCDHSRQFAHTETGFAIAAKLGQYLRSIIAAGFRHLNPANLGIKPDPNAAYPAVAQRYN